MQCVPYVFDWVVIGITDDLRSFSLAQRIKRVYCTSQTNVCTKVISDSVQAERLQRPYGVMYMSSFSLLLLLCRDPEPRRGQPATGVS